MNYEDLRITKLRAYLFNVIDEITNNSEQINANMLDKDINNYSLDKIPVDTEMENWIIGISIKRDVFSFRSRKAYSQDTINNLKNIGFFETFEKKIKDKNNKGILPDIENIESISCLNCGTMITNESNNAIFDIQIQITYREEETYGQVSM